MPDPATDLFVPFVHAHHSGEAGARANAYLIETARGVIAVDALFTIPEATALRARLDAIGKPLLAVVLTHGDPDHVGGVSTLIGQDTVPVVSARSIAPAIDATYADTTLLRRALGAAWADVKVPPTDLLDDGGSITFDGVTLTVRELDRANRRPMRSGSPRGQTGGRSSPATSW